MPRSRLEGAGGEGPAPRKRASGSKAESQRGLWKLFAYPVLFAIVSFALVYGLIATQMRTYTDILGMVMDAPPQATERILFSSPTPDGGGLESSVPVPQLETIPVSSIVRPQTGEMYAKLTVEGTNIADAPVYWGDNDAQLNKGVGTYVSGWLPGFGRTVMMAGHRNTVFKDLGSAEIGGLITVQTHYETYVYRIIETAVFGMNDTSAYDFKRKEENLILYTCYPFGGIAPAKQRYFVYAEPVSGKSIAR